MPVFFFTSTDSILHSQLSRGSLLSSFHLSLHWECCPRQQPGSLQAVGTDKHLLAIICPQHAQDSQDELSSGTDFHFPPLTVTIIIVITRISPITYNTVTLLSLWGRLQPRSMGNIMGNVMGNIWGLHKIYYKITLF